ncbi:MAG: PAS domain-containing sensor histidine kinase [Acidimicrobiales bacterium]
MPDTVQVPEEYGVGRLFWMTSEAIVVADLHSQEIALWNPAAEQLFGYTPAEALGMPLEVLVPEHLLGDHLAGIRRYRDGGQPVLVGGAAKAVPATTKAGERRDVSLSLTDVSPSGSIRRYVLAIIRDVTAHLRAERELAAANDAMREFIATASHDLRTPLASVLGFGKLLLDDAATSADERRQFAEAIVRGAEGAARLVDDLLTLSQIRAAVLTPRPEPVALAAAVRVACEQAVSSAELVVDESLVVLADPDHLERMLVNYLSNAERYGAPPVHVRAVAVGETVEVRVCDGGPGVPEGFVERLFHSFARASPSRRDGTGLGLSIVKGLAAVNDGRAFYESNDPTGSCFGIVLPAAPS